MTGQLLFRGLSAKVGIFHGPIVKLCPHSTTGLPCPPPPATQFKEQMHRTSSAQHDILRNTSAHVLVEMMPAFSCCTAKCMTGCQLRTGYYYSIVVLQYDRSVLHVRTGRADYFGTPVNRAARLWSGCNAGQVGTALPLYRTATWMLWGLNRHFLLRNCDVG